MPQEFFEFVQRRGEAALRSGPSWGLCHNDFQPGNILRSAPGVLTIIDWDNAIWSPREADLMFIPAKLRSLFEEGYGPMDLNESVLAYVSCNWVLQEMFDCADRVLFSARASDEEKRWALRFAILLAKQMKSFEPDPSYSRFPEG